MQSGIVIGGCQPRHRAKEFLRFLRKIDRTVQENLDLHLIMENYSAHKTAKVKAWLKKHPRFHVHFLPTSSSWLNLVERFFADITDKRIRRGAFASVGELEAAIDDYLLRHSAIAKPYHWTKSATEILAKERRALDKLEAVKSGYQASESEHWCSAVPGRAARSVRAGNLFGRPRDMPGTHCPPARPGHTIGRPTHTRRRPTRAARSLRHELSRLVDHR